MRFQDGMSMFMAADLGLDKISKWLQWVLIQNYVNRDMEKRNSQSVIFSSGFLKTNYDWFMFKNIDWSVADKLRYRK